MSAVPPARLGVPGRSIHEQRGASSHSGCHTLFIQTTSAETALGVTEGAIRHHVTRLQAGSHDGRSRQEPKAACVAAAIDDWRQMQGDTPINLAVLHAWLVSKHGYSGSLRSIQRYWARTYPAPAVQAWLAAFEWMRAVLQKEISPDALRREVGDIPDFPVLLHRLYDGRLS